MTDIVGRLDAERHKLPSNASDSIADTMAEAAGRINILTAELAEARAETGGLERSNASLKEQIAADDIATASADKRLAEARADNQCQKELLEECQANRDAWWKALDLCKAELAEARAEVKRLQDNVECFMNNKWSEIELAVGGHKGTELWKKLHGIESLDDLRRSADRATTAESVLTACQRERDDALAEAALNRNDFGTIAVYAPAGSKPWDVAQAALKRLSAGALKKDQSAATTKAAELVELVNAAPTIASQDRWESLQQKAADILIARQAAFAPTGQDSD